ncbi:TasA family protein [Wansuia hejianensis]|uniref:Camelysin metallo-endopeptidase n=1 Tax=Wansuia hejianensis TaxID=2763667 RepID=A0A7G9GBU6_9FIRM|nr:TasA family protein [Wansuia hejianensis]QNM08278.1 Camelysin metallo-endopeptidase [Wansuia hejianensis]
MKRGTKTIMLAAALAGVLIVGGVSAYFTDADTATNTFTVGKISLDLQEPSWNPDQVKDLTPNQVVQKDPQIKNDGINDEFVFLEVTVPYKNVVTVNDAGVKQTAADTELVKYTVNAGWTELGSGEKDTVAETVLHRYVYGTDQACTALAKDQVTPALFDSITVANVVEDQTLEQTTQNIQVEAFGIQANDIGADDKTAPSDVWKVLVNQGPSKDKTGEDTKTDIVGG